MARTASVRRATPSREKAWLREAAYTRRPYGRAVMTHQRCSLVSIFLGTRMRTEKGGGERKEFRKNTVRPARADIHNYTCRQRQNQAVDGRPIRTPSYIL